MVVGAGWVAQRTVESMRYDLDLTFDDAGCTLLPLPTAAEDMVPLGDGHCAIAGGGDLKAAFARGSAAAAPGAFHLVNLTAGTVRPLEVLGAAVPKLVLHGMHLAPGGSRLYAVNHDEARGESVEVFAVEAGPRLRHVGGIRSPLFSNCALNDVVAGGADEVFVTEWLPFGLPRGGRQVGGWRLRVATLMSLVGLRTTRVFRCVVSSGECAVASAARWTAANGIAVARDGQTVYVNDPPRRAITVLRRLPSGELEATGELRTRHVVDNIDMAADGAGLVGGSIPLPHTCHTVCDEAPGLALARRVGGRRVGCDASPGGLLRIPLRAGEPQRDWRMHDGSRLSGVSAALELGGRAALSSPFSAGVLVCR